MVKTGDRVRFLNSVGGGIVKSFQNKHTVLVEDESGFDFPIPVSECVVVNEGAGFPHSSPPPKEEPPAVKQPPQKEPVRETPGGERLNVYLACLPVDPKAITQSGYEAYIINESNYYLYFNYMNCSNSSWTSRCRGEVEPNTKIFMEEFRKEDLNDLERICVQLMAYKKGKPFTLKNVYSVELRIDTVKFYKAHCFTENDFFEEAALVFPVVRADVPERQLLVSATELQEAMQQKRKDPPAPAPAVSKPRQTPPPAIEVDLHIHQLLDSTGGMSAAEMLNCQLDKFHETMRRYADRKGQKIIFIHGKGEGVLRTAIEKELKTRYKSCEYRDASFREYGFGATSVKIR